MGWEERTEPGGGGLPLQGRGNHGRPETGEQPAPLPVQWGCWEVSVWKGGAETEVCVCVWGGAQQAAGDEHPPPGVTCQPGRRNSRRRRAEAGQPGPGGEAAGGEATVMGARARVRRVRQPVTPWWHPGPVSALEPEGAGAAPSRRPSEGLMQGLLGAGQHPGDRGGGGALPVHLCSSHLEQHLAHRRNLVNVCPETHRESETPACLQGLSMHPAITHASSTYCVLG